MTNQYHIAENYIHKKIVQITQQKDCQCKGGSTWDSQEQLFVIVGNILKPLTVVTKGTVLEVAEILMCLCLKK